MNVSYYPLVNKPSAPKGVDILRVLDDTKEGKYKSIISKIRLKIQKKKETL